MISVVIRTKNEISTLPALINQLRKQTYKDFEIVVIDNNSTDGTKKYCDKNVDRVVHIFDEDFSHARSCNLGVQNSRGNYIYFTNGHCLPISTNLLETANNILGRKDCIAGVYGCNYPHKEKNRRNLYELLLSLFDKPLFPKNYKEFSSIRPGMLQTTSCCVRKELLESHPFKAMRSRGGEDLLLAKEILKEDYSIAYTPELDVYHSHGGSIWKAFKRHIGYLIMIFEVVFIR